MSQAPWRLLASSLTFALVACSSGSGANGGSGGFGGDGTNQTFLGAWSGRYGTRPAQLGAALLDTHPAKATFVGQTDDSAGQFKIELTDETKAEVSGSFTRFMNTDLQLTVGFSTLSTIGTDLQYKLVGNSLQLQNDQVALQLTRDAGTNDGAGGNPTPQSGGTNPPNPAGAEPVMGTWSCSDPRGNHWTLLNRDNATFDIDVTAPGAARGGLFLDGTLTITRGKTDADAELVVTSSSVAKYVGWDFRMNAAGQSATLRRMQAATTAGQQPTVVETITCQKQN